MNGEEIIALSYFPYFADLTQPLLPRDSTWETPAVARVDEAVALDVFISAKL